MKNRTTKGATIAAAVALMLGVGGAGVAVFRTRGSASYQAGYQAVTNALDAKRGACAAQDMEYSQLLDKCQPKSPPTTQPTARQIEDQAYRDVIAEKEWAMLTAEIQRLNEAGAVVATDMDAPHVTAESVLAGWCRGQGGSLKPMTTRTSVVTERPYNYCQPPAGEQFMLCRQGAGDPEWMTITACSALGD